VFNKVATNRVRCQLIEDHWPDICRVAGTLHTRAATASDLVRVLQRSGQPTTLGRAIAELGSLRGPLAEPAGNGRPVPLECEAKRGPVHTSFSGKRSTSLSRRSVTVARSRPARYSAWRNSRSLSAPRSTSRCTSPSSSAKIDANGADERRADPVHHLSFRGTGPAPTGTKDQRAFVQVALQLVVRGLFARGGSGRRHAPPRSRRVGSAQTASWAKYFSSCES
jgi:hypothetical protein